MLYINTRGPSNGAMELKMALAEGGLRTLLSRREPGRMKVRPHILFWGNSEPQFPLIRFRDKIINHPTGIKVMANKLRFFQRVGHLEIVPQWTTEAPTAVRWDADKVVCRHVLEGSGGAGIEIVNRGVPIPQPAPLYVKYEKKTHEYRVHMARGRDGVYSPILIQRKVFRKTPERPEPKSWEVRNHDNGFIYVQANDFPTPDVVVANAKRVMELFPELHFAALDVIYHEPTKLAYVLEGNTAPGLEGNTVRVYRDYLRALLS
jgi:hypothetical protein